MDEDRPPRCWPAAADRRPARARAWKPTERVNYIIGVAPGGRVDLYARGIRDALEIAKLVNSQTVLVENRSAPGAAGDAAAQEPMPATRTT